MIELSKNQIPAKRFQGRHAASGEMTTQQARLEAQALLSRGLSPQCWGALDMLATGGVLSLAQLKLSERVLRKYAALRLLDRLPYPTRELGQAFNEYGLPVGSNGVLLYTLGLVGIEIARIRHGSPPPTGYLFYPLERTLHDVVLNEIVLRLAHYADSLNWSVKWASRHEAKLIKDGETLMEPEALLVLRKENQEMHFLIEYHDEDKPTRAYDKVRLYETVFSAAGWQSQWDTDSFPMVLAVFKMPIVGQGYQAAIKDRQQVNCRYYGKVLNSVLEGNLGEWQNIAAGLREQLFDG